MTQILNGRFTAQTEEPIVVFLIGMRFNRLLAVRKWWPVFTAMPRMLMTLMPNPEKGLLGATTWLSWRQVMVVQYWRSFEDLENFARSKEEPHLSAWRDYNRNIGADGTVGFWHETYLVEPDKFECVYGNMPVFGLAAATEHVAATGLRETARGRLGGESEPAVQSPPA